MQSRTRIAILLIALIMGGNLLYSAHLQNKRLQKAEAARQARAADSLAALAASPLLPGPGGVDAPAGSAAAPAPTTPQPAAPPTLSEMRAAALFPAATPDAGELIIETPLQRIVLSRAGGLVRSIQLHDFDVYGNGPVDLVPDGLQQTRDRNALGIVLRTPTGDVALDAARFDPEDGVFDAGGVLRLEPGSPPRTVTLRAAATGGGGIAKRFTFHADRYVFDFALASDPGPAMPRIDAYTLDWTTGMPVTEQSVREDQTRFRIAAAIGEDLVAKKTGDFKKTHAFSTPGAVRFACLQSKYFTIALVPAAPIQGTTEMVGENRTHWIGMRLTQPAPWRAGAETYHVYAGPIEPARLRELGVGLESTVELGWNWIRPISNAVLAFMNFLSRFIPNYGIVIIIVSVLAKLVFWPLTEKAFRSMRRMQEMQPRMEEIRRRYKDDPRAMNEQMMLMYREQKINPLGGCMPMLVQMPMFFALFSALQSSIELRNAPFVGWIDNLSGPDVLATLPTSLPVIGNHLSLLPFIMGATMLWQAKLTPSMGATSGPQAAAMRQQAFLMRWVMPIMMTFIFYKMPSGLVIYWIVTTLMGIWQQSHINKKMGPIAPPVVVGNKGDGIVSSPASSASPAHAKAVAAPGAGAATQRRGRAGTQRR